MVGKSLGHYDVLESLGAGAMGDVYRAFDTNLRRDVAIKVLPRDLAEDPERVARLRREAQLLAAVNHGNIASIYSFEEHSGTRFLVLELIDGRNLDRVLAGALSIGDALDLCAQVAEALDAAHRAGIIHRDLKPSNIVVTPDLQAKVLDFGIAKPIERGSRAVETEKVTALTGTGVIVGTACYMSPEQIRQQPIDKGVDVWAFGCLLFECLAGKRAFDRETMGDTLSAILEHDPDWSALPSGTPAAVDALIRSCLQKDSHRRTSNLADAAALLRGAVADAPRRPPAPTSGARQQNWRADRRLGYIGVAIGLVAVATILAFGISQFAAPAQPAPAAAPSYRQVTFTGDATDAAISPDGASIVYVTGQYGEYQRLMIADLAGGQAVEILGATSVLMPAWSPDGSSLTVAVARDESTTFQVYRVPRLGGAPRQIGPGVFSAWSPEGDRIATALQNSGFWLFSESGPSIHVVLDGIDFNRGLSWSPTGDRLALLVNNTATGIFEIFTVDPNGDDRRSVISLLDPLSSPRWAPTGDAIYFLRHRNNVADLLRIDRGEGEVPWLEPIVVLSGLQATEAINAGFSIAADGRTLAYSTRLVYANLWLGERAGDDASQAYTARPLTSGTALIERPSISPDGRWIAYSMQTSGGSNIFKMPIDGGDPVQLTFSEAYETSPAFSPDGHSIAFAARDAGVARLWTMRSDGTQPREFPQTEVSATGLRVVWSPGARPLYQRPGNQNFFYLNPQTGEQEPLVPDAAFDRRPDEPRGFTFYPEFAPDGERVAITWNRFPAQALWVITAEPYSERTVIRDGTLYAIGWSADGQWIFVAPSTPSAGFFGRVPAAGGDLEVLLELPGNVRYGSVDPHTERVVTTVGEERSDTFVVRDFDRSHR